MIQWLRTSSPPAAGYRDDLYLKLVAGARAGPDELSGVLRRERETQFAELRALRELAAREHDPLAALLTEGAALHVQARLALLELAAQEIAALVAAADPSTSAAGAGAEAPPPARRRAR